MAENFLFPPSTPNPLGDQKIVTENERKRICQIMFILGLLVKLKHNPDIFPIKEGMVVYNKDFNETAISKQEIIRWQHINCQDNEDWKITEDLFDELMVFCAGFVSKLQYPTMIYYSWSL